jgi:hypothetical protein
MQYRISTATPRTVERNGPPCRGHVIPSRQLPYSRSE